MNKQNVAVYALCFCLGCFLGRLLINSSGAGRVEARGVAPHSPITASPTGCPTTRDGIDDAAGTSFSSQQQTPRAARPKGTESTQTDAVGSLQPVGHDGFNEAATFADFSDEMQPTADGLAASTIDLWNSPDFLRLSVDDARALLPIDDDMGFRGPDSWVTLLGGLPTRADIDSAVNDPMVKCALEAACAQEMVYRELQMLPEDRRSIDYGTALRTAETQYLRSWELLMGTLDARSKYHSWSLLWRAWQRWSE
jgi:hypothetical protein